MHECDITIFKNSSSRLSADNDDIKLFLRIWLNLKINLRRHFPQYKLIRQSGRPTTKRGQGYFFTGIEGSLIKHNHKPFY